MKQNFNTRKGILMAGGFGKRLQPMTLCYSKHLLPIYDQPMIFYSLYILKLLGIQEVAIITSKNDLSNIKSIIDSNCGPNLPSADSTIVESGSVSGSVSGSPSPNGVSSFSSATQGANIASAFNNPLPKGTNTDKVNFNQNNNKKYNAKDYLPDKKALKQIPKDKQFEGDFTSAKYKLEGESGLIPVQQFTIGAESGTSGSNKGSWWGIRGLGATFINPRFNVSAWNNSTRVPDNNRKPLSC